jgi:hypothetical protein
MTSPRRDNFLMRTGAIWLPVLFAPATESVTVLQPVATATCQLIDSRSTFGRPRRQVRVDSVLAN